MCVWAERGVCDMVGLGWVCVRYEDVGWGARCSVCERDRSVFLWDRRERVERGWHCYHLSMHLILLYPHPNIHYLSLLASSMHPVL